MEFHVVIPVLISFAISLVLGPIVIPFLRRLKMGQTERELGVQSHLKKNGTPTMGGVIFLIATTVTSLFYIRDYPMIIPVLFLTLGFGLIGFLDDYLKVVLKRSDGLLPWQKMALQIVVTAVFAFYLVNYSNVSLTMKIPFWSGHYLNLGWFAVPVLFFAVIGTVNGVNFTDGLDGLASSVTLIVAVFFTVVSLGMNSGVEPITCAVVGSLMGFLLFNVYPAKVFMGDTGSLALGGFVAGVAYAMQMPLFIILVGLIYLIEVLSVMIQVSYFKATHGKRIFKMAPIHHHFELCGWVRDTGRCSVLCCNCHYVPDRSPGIIRRNRKMDLKGKKVLVFGAGKSGIGAADLLGSVGAQPIIYDGNENLDKEAVLHKNKRNIHPGDLGRCFSGRRDGKS